VYFNFRTCQRAEQLGMATDRKVDLDAARGQVIGERVVVMSARPGRIVAQFDVHLPHAGSRRELIRHPEFTDG
jgi:ABC-type taurine transport system ATPase subunit